MPHTTFFGLSSTDISYLHAIRCTEVTTRGSGQHSAIIPAGWTLQPMATHSFLIDAAGNVRAELIPSPGPTKPWRLVPRSPFIVTAFGEVLKFGDGVALCIHHAATQEVGYRWLAANIGKDWADPAQRWETTAEGQ